MIKRLIFDIDGTLSTCTDFDKAIKETLIENNIYTEENLKIHNLELSKYERKYGKYDEKLYLKYFSDVFNTKLDDSYLDSLFKNLYKYSTPDYDAEEVRIIENLSKKYELVLLSNFFEKLQRSKLEYIGINKYFKEYHGVRVTKPNKEASLDAIGNNKPEECIMIGDNLNLDILEAQKYGIKTIWVNNKNTEQCDVVTERVCSIKDINEDLINKLA